MAKKLVTDGLWEVIEPLLPEDPPKPNDGRPRIDDRAALSGILFVLKSGILWEMLPQEMGCGSGMTCWSRIKEWREAGVWEELHRTLLDLLGKADQIDWERASVDSASVAAPRGPEAMRGSHETIYRTLFVQARGALKRELLAHFRSGRMMRKGRHASTAGQKRGQIRTPSPSVSVRPRPKTGRCSATGEGTCYPARATLTWRPWSPPPSLQPQGSSTFGRLSGHFCCPERGTQARFPVGRCVRAVEVVTGRPRLTTS